MTILTYENPTGPYPILLALATLYATQIPWTDRVSLFGLHVSNKVYIYLVLAQFLFLRAPGSLVTGACGVIACTVYHYDLLVNKKRLVLFAAASRVGHLVAPWIGVDATPIPRRRGPSRGRIAPPAQPMAVGNAQRMDGTPLEAYQPPPVQISEENIATLVSMGFSRQEAAFALQMAADDPEVAANILFSNQEN